MRDTSTTADRRPRPPDLRRRARPWLIGAGIAFLAVAIAAAVTIAVLLDRYAADLPSVDDLGNRYKPPQVTRIYARDGRTVIGEMHADEGFRTIVPLERIPPVLVNAVIAAEDAQFRTHAGMDWLGMVRALAVNMWEGYYAQGGSTITQQVVRTFYLGREKTLERKMKEVLLARRVEQHLTKDQILFLYLNQICFGHARYGVEEAARYYFGKGASDVTLAEAALLAALPKGPAVYSPRVDAGKALARRRYVLSRMAALGMIADAERAAADAEPIRLVPEPRASAPWAAEFVEAVEAELRERLGEDALRRGGYAVITTMNPDLQRAVRRAALAGLAAIDERHGYRGPAVRREGDAAPSPGGVEPGPDEVPDPNRIHLGRVIAVDDRAGTIRFRVGAATGDVRLAEFARYNPEGLAPSRFAEIGGLARVRFAVPPQAGRVGRLRLEMGPEVAVVVLDPRTGEVAAMVGGSIEARGQFNRALRSRRQPGSAFKPIVYLAAIESRRFTPATVVNDAPEVYGAWRPENATRGRFAGPVPLRVALARSINLVAVKILERTGVDAVIALARRLGISSELRRELSLALGASEVTPIELTAAMAAVAAGGMRVTPTVLREIRGPGGAALPVPRPQPTRATDAASAYVLTDMLRSVIEDRDGTAHAAAGALGRPAAGKTGTSTDVRDCWFVGFTPQWAAGVWVGFDDNLPVGAPGPEGTRSGRGRPGGVAESGARAALPIWVEAMRAAHAGPPIAPFERPEGATTALVDPATGLLAQDGMAGAREEVFVEGTAPTRRAPRPGLRTPADFAIGEAEWVTDAGTLALREAP
ncbi:MAG: PBP1A family penicillin-binding protein [Myxococcota bacterium]|nr:PBP1A family penicillin-binding protein [Myxococcota bacterium]